MPLYPQPVLGLMVSGSTVACEYNDIHYAPAALPCIVMSERPTYFIGLTAHVQLGYYSDFRMYIPTNLCMYLCTLVLIIYVFS